MLFIHGFIMKYGVPVGTFVNDDYDTEFDYQWFDNESDALSFAQTLDKPYDVINNIITLGA
jgi:hypothetical protein